MSLVWSEEFRIHTYELDPASAWPPRPCWDF